MPQTTIRMVPDNHSAHISKGDLSLFGSSSQPVRVHFHADSWLLAQLETLRGIRVSSKQELKNRIEQYLAEINKTPVVFRWKYRIDEFSAA